MDRENWLPRIDWATCTGCGDCIALCPTGALGFRGEKAAVVNPDACTYAAECETVCPVAAIALPYQVIMESGLNDDHAPY
jgi:ferredoxin